VNAECSRNVVGGGDHAACIGPSTNHHRFAFKLQIVMYFHRGEEGIHIHMQDGTHTFRHVVSRSSPDAVHPSGVLPLTRVIQEPILNVGSWV